MLSICLRIRHTVHKRDRVIKPGERASEQAWWQYHSSYISATHPPLPPRPFVYSTRDLELMLQLGCLWTGERKDASGGSNDKTQ
jgi:hypothetical protein